MLMIARSGRLGRRRGASHQLRDAPISGQFAIQLTGLIATLVWSVLLSLIIVKLVQILVGLRITAETEQGGHRREGAWRARLQYVTLRRRAGGFEE